MAPVGGTLLLRTPRRPSSEDVWDAIRTSLEPATTVGTPHAAGIPPVATMDATTYPPGESGGPKTATATRSSAWRSRVAAADTDTSRRAWDRTPVIVGTAEPSVMAREFRRPSRGGPAGSPLHYLPSVPKHVEPVPISSPKLLEYIPRPREEEEEQEEERYDVLEAAAPGPAPESQPFLSWCYTAFAEPLIGLVWAYGWAGVFLLVAYAVARILFCRLWRFGLALAFVAYTGHTLVRLCLSYLGYYPRALHPDQCDATQPGLLVGPQRRLRDMVSAVPLAEKEPSLPGVPYARVRTGTAAVPPGWTPVGRFADEQRRLEDFGLSSNGRKWTAANTTPLFHRVEENEEVLPSTLKVLEPSQTGQPGELARELHQAAIQQCQQLSFFNTYDPKLAPAFLRLGLCYATEHPEAAARSIQLARSAVSDPSSLSLLNCNEAQLASELLRRASTARQQQRG